MKAKIYYKENFDWKHYTIVMRGNPKSHLNGIGIQIGDSKYCPIEKQGVHTAYFQQTHYFAVGDNTLGKVCANPPQNIVEIARWFEREIKSKC